jgi:lipoate---protein ligase
MSSRKIDYTLPDSVLLDSKDSRLMIWQPEYPVIVVGQSNSPEKYVLLEKALIEGIPVIKRPTGGETVVLTPRMLIISLVLKSAKLPGSKDFFKRINNILIPLLEKSGLQGVCYRGISDLAVADKKILGSSIYRKPGMLFYHAVLNYGESPEYIASYLKHPAREPDYRKGRSHSEFVTTMEASGIKDSIPDLISKLEVDLQVILNNSESTFKGDVENAV